MGGLLEAISEAIMHSLGCTACDVIDRKWGLAAALGFLAAFAVVVFMCNA